MMQRYVDSHEITLPPLDVSWTYSGERFSKENFWSRVSLNPHQYYNTTHVNDLVKIKFDKSELCYEGERPTALELTYNASKLYIAINPPATFCKQSKARSFFPNSYLVLDVSKAVFENLTSEQCFHILSKGMSNWHWGHNVKAIKALDLINAENDRRQEALRREMEELNKKRQKQQEEEKRRRELYRQQLEKQVLEREKHFKKQTWQNRNQAADFQTGILQPEATQAKRNKGIQKSREVCLKEGYAESKDLFEKGDQSNIIRDSYGQRWVKCEICGEIKPDYDFGSYGGLNHVNMGTCRDCGKK